MLVNPSLSKLWNAPIHVESSKQLRFLTVILIRGGQPMLSTRVVTRVTLVPVFGDGSFLFFFKKGEMI